MCEKTVLIYIEQIGSWLENKLMWSGFMLSHIRLKAKSYKIEEEKKEIENKNENKKHH